MLIKELVEMDDRIKKTNKQHIFNKFIVKNFGYRVRIGDKEGILVGTTANKELFKFGLTLRNENNGEFDYTNIKITDEEGNFILFKEFCDIHQCERDIALYDVEMEDYIALKMMIDEHKYIQSIYQKEIKKMNDAGIILPPKDSNYEYTKKEKKNITVPAFIAEIDYENKFSFKIDEYEPSIEKLQEFVNMKNNISYKIIPSINFYTRCIEFGLYKNNFHTITEGIERDFKFPKKKIKWDKLNNIIDGVDIRFRDFTKKI